ncbi:MAG: flavodoxin family protein [Kiritimatiellae bacterium]|jgi:multimeric flavodoxin WrbA|nr:flavodoxin family protein [Kiritimatiellia bacterium]MBQ2630991.1 flavodoxin family protein [Kiritimatiellia bacterium]MBQ3288793.1 flavodoxin family protein [Kiritimatiellia bacterium]MBQ3341815.1 flavodoxin family protein [Kiritimatiellia bacterium]MBQ3746054.1 flavodoxin family protein [Kiritimatiellia bacterium]
MKITILTGSAHPKGTTNTLATAFAEGAQTAGHEVFRFNCATAKVRPCIGCNQCGCGQRECVFKDDFVSALVPRLLEADVVVLCAPTYYFALSPQLATVVSRWYSVNPQMTGGKRSLLIAACEGPAKDVMVGIEATYERILNWMHWQDAGRIIAGECPTAAALEDTDLVQRAHDLGFSMK